MATFYSTETLESTLINTFNGQWRNFALSKEGMWCYRNNKSFYNTLKTKFARAFKNNYTEKELKDALKNKYQGNWRNFSMNKEGKWCRDNNPKLFSKLRDNFQGQNFEFREMEYQKEFIKKISKFLNARKVKFTIEQEVSIGICKGIKNRIDVILTLEEYALTFPIELKHDDSTWTQKELKDQKERYTECLKNTALEPYFVSPKGKYGFSEEEFFFILNNLIQKEEVLLANSLDWFREEKRVA